MGKFWQISSKFLAWLLMKIWLDSNIVIVKMRWQNSDIVISNFAPFAVFHEINIYSKIGDFIILILIGQNKCKHWRTMKWLAISVCVLFWSFYQSTLEKSAVARYQKRINLISGYYKRDSGLERPSFCSKIISQ